MATHGFLLPSSLAAPTTAIRAIAAPARTCHRALSSSHGTRRRRRRRRPLALGRRAPAAMDALRVTGAAEPLLLRPSVGGHPRLRVRRPAPIAG
jgi:hypothetical protein